MTYGDSGNVIPLSERFNEDEEDIRYSKSYAEAQVNQDILAMIRSVENKSFKDNDSVSLGTVSNNVGKKIKDAIGIDASGWNIKLEARQIRHILKDHGINGKTDHSMGDPKDIAKMQYVMDSPDDVIDAGTTETYTYYDGKKNRHANTVRFEESIGDKSYYLVEAVPDNDKKTVFVVSAYIGKTGAETNTKRNSRSPSMLYGAETVPQNPVATPESVAAENPCVYNTTLSEESQEDQDNFTRSSRRVKDDPKNTVDVYKLMRLKDRKLYPLFIDSTEPIDVGVWYDADSLTMDFLKKMPSGVYLVDPENGSYQSLADYQSENGEKAGKDDRICTALGIVDKLYNNKVTGEERSTAEATLSRLARNIISDATYEDDPMREDREAAT